MLVLSKGDRAIDYSWARPDLTVAAKTGARFVCRYLSWDTSGKNLSKAEAAAIRKAGLGIVLNWESQTGRANGGAANAVVDATEAVRQARALGAPKGTAICFSHDCDTYRWSNILAYYRKARQIVEAAGYEFAELGAYGSADLLDKLGEAGIIRHGWQTIAWSYGRVSKYAAVYQNGKSWFAGGADENVVLIPAAVKLWAPVEPAPVSKARTVTVKVAHAGVSTIVGAGVTAVLLTGVTAGQHVSVSPTGPKPAPTVTVTKTVPAPAPKPVPSPTSLTCASACVVTIQKAGK